MLPPAIEVEEFIVDEADEAAKDIAADIEGGTLFWRGYWAVMARDWYQELPARVCKLVDNVGFDLFCSRLVRLLASRALLSALVKRWWDTTNSFHFSLHREDDDDSLRLLDDHWLESRG
ncbi:hypothetical protein ACSBR1_022823 [Camellia fascicularis]